MVAVYSSVLALLLATVLVPVLAHWAGTLGLMDSPGPRKIHHESVPRVGGIAIAVGALVAAIVWLPPRPEIAGYLTGAVVIFVSGLLDDRFNLDYRLKFLGQIAGALIFLYLGDIHLVRAPFVTDGVMPVWLGVPLTIIAIVGITNAINLSDGMDGLAGGTSLLSAGALGYMAYVGGDKPVAILALCLMGATLGFLRYNTHPARVFMGDSGSQFLGFSVAALAIMLIERSDIAVSPVVPLLVLGLPIVDTLQVMIRRILSGNSPFSPDRRHLHHRLLDIGLSQYAAVMIVYVLQSALILIAWSLRYGPDILLLGVFFLFTATLLMGLRAWEHKRVAQRLETHGLAWIDPLVEYLRANSVLGRLGHQGVLYAVSFLFPAVALLTPSVSPDVGWLSLLLSIALVLTLLPRELLPALAIGRLAAFTTSVLVIYLAESQGLGWATVTDWLHAYLLLILFFVALWLRFGGGGNFRLNALDVLIVLVVAIVPNMPVVRELGIAPMVVESLLLFYACELMLNEPSLRWDLLRMSTFGALGILAVRGILFAGV